MKVMKEKIWERRELVKKRGEWWCMRGRKVSSGQYGPSFLISEQEPKKSVKNIEINEKKKFYNFQRTKKLNKKKKNEIKGYTNCCWHDFFFLSEKNVNTLRISIMISLGSREEVVFILHVKRRDRGFTWSSFTSLL